MIECRVYIPSKIVIEKGVDEDEVLKKVWRKVRGVYNGRDLQVFQTDDSEHCSQLTWPDGKEFDYTP